MISRPFMGINNDVETVCVYLPSVVSNFKDCLEPPGLLSIITPTSAAESKASAAFCSAFFSCTSANGH